MPRYHTIFSWKKKSRSSEKHLLTMADTLNSTHADVTSDTTLTDPGEISPPSYGAEDGNALLPPPYYSRENVEALRADDAFLSSRGRSGTLSKCWKWIAEEVASSTSVPSHRRNPDMCFGACCRG
ncbi:hypothetical protein V8C35DRAFT_314633 [Trichoderma chlorosporum]